MVCFLTFHYAELNLGELLHDKLWVTLNIVFKTNFKKKLKQYFFLGDKNEMTHQ